MEQIVKIPNQSGISPVQAGTETSPKMKVASKPMTPQNVVITAELLDVFLYGKRKIHEIDIEDAKRQKTGDKRSHEVKIKSDKNTVAMWCEKCQSRHNPGRSCGDPMNLLYPDNSLSHDIKLTYAVLSFPPEVQLCTSTIPGYTYGVCAKQLFPVGTWIGPYEGKRVEAEDLTANSDSCYIWEIYKDGKFSHFLDGNDESTSSWMRYIRCARHKGEQNMVVFQYGNNIYYRAVRDIAHGAELLVWYNNNYTQFLGVPLGLRNVPGGKKTETQVQTTVKSETSAKTPCKESKTSINEVSNGEGSHVATTPPTNVVHHPKQNMHTTNTTYCYGATVSPTQSYMKYMNFSQVQPTMTIEHRPVPNSAVPNSPVPVQKSPTMPDNGPQYPPATPQNAGNYSYFMPPATQPPIKTSTSSVSIFHGDHNSDAGKGPWKCNKCQESFDQLLVLEMHMCCKLPEKPYQCGHCSESFVTPSELGDHMITHSNARPFKCGFCGRTFSGPVSLNNHIHYTHSRNGRSFFCQNCGATFSVAAQFSRHMRTPGECPMSLMRNLNETQSATATPYTTTLTRG